MHKNRRFVLFFSENDTVVASDRMDIEDMILELRRRGMKQLPVAAGWMREANRSDYYLADGLVILCVSGKRATSGGKLSTVFALLKEKRAKAK